SSNTVFTASGRALVGLRRAGVSRADREGEGYGRQIVGEGFQPPSRRIDRDARERPGGLQEPGGRDSAAAHQAVLQHALLRSASCAGEETWRRRLRVVDAILYSTHPAVDGADGRRTRRQNARPEGRAGPASD